MESLRTSLILFKQNSLKCAFEQNQSVYDVFIFAKYNQNNKLKKYIYCNSYPAIQGRTIQQIPQQVHRLFYYMTLSTLQVIDLSDLLSLLTNTVAQSCVIMHQTASFNIMMKQPNDPVTQIDYKIQYKIVTDIKKKFPKIQIIGQEDLKTMENIANPSSNSKSLSSHSDTKITLPSQLFDLGSVVAQELCIWIDPLDCTRGFLANKRYECTINVGVSYKGTPMIGVIGQPYKKKTQIQIDNENFKYIYRPTVTIGCINSLTKNCFQLQILNNKWSRINFRQDWLQQSQEKTIQNGKTDILEKSHPKIAISSRRTTSLQNKLMNHLEAQQVLTGGAGHKILLVIRGQIDAMMFIGVKTSWWDSCAGEAIIKSMGGFFIQPDLNSIDYDYHSSSFTNTTGFICVINPGLYHQIHNYLQKNENQKIQNYQELQVKAQ